MRLQELFSEQATVITEKWGFEAALQSKTIVGVDFEWVQPPRGFRTAIYTLRYHADMPDKMFDWITMDLYEEMKPYMSGDGFLAHLHDDPEMEFDRQSSLFIVFTRYLGSSEEERVARKLGTNLSRVLHKREHIEDNAWFELNHNISRFRFKDFHPIPPHRRVLVQDVSPFTPKT